jgi:HSP20 family protein
MLPVIKSSFPSLMNEFLNDDWFDGFFNIVPVKNNMPTVNIIEEKDQFRLEIAAPGLEKEDFKLDLHNDVLTISAEKKQENEEKNKKYLRREFSYCSFKRSFSLPEYVDSDKIEAKHKNGILTITIPKKEEAKEKEPKTIKIE